MIARGLLKAGFAALFVLSTAAYAEDAPKKDDAPKTETPAPAPRGRLTKPFSDLKDLTPEQTVKIKEIHSKYLAEEAALRAKDHDESMAVLTDDQKKEIAEVTTKATADKKAVAAAAKTDKKAPAPADATK